MIIFYQFFAYDSLFLNYIIGVGKHKIDINKNSLSWEKTFFRKCDNKDCNSEGKFKAPKSRVMLNQYYYFCMEHIFIKSILLFLYGTY